MPDTFSLTVSRFGILFQVFYAADLRSSRANGCSGPTGTELLRRGRSAEPTGPPVIGASSLQPAETVLFRPSPSAEARLSIRAPGRSE